MRPNKILCLLTILIVLRVFPTVLFEDFSSPYFPPAGWVVYNLDGGHQVWRRSAAKSRSEPACARSRFESPNQRNDDWLVTKRLFPYPGADTLKFWYRAHECNFPESLEVLLSLTGNQPKDFSIRLDAFGFTSEEYQLRVIPLSDYHYTPIYIAFRNVGIFGVNSCYLDDVSGVGTILNDVGVISILSPSFTEEEGREVYPEMTIKNYGQSSPSNFLVGMIIKNSLSQETVYNSHSVVSKINPNETQLITFAESWYTSPGEYDVIARTFLLNDGNPNNDRIERKTVVADQYQDVGILSILSPRGLLPPGEITPAIKVVNYGNTEETISSYLRILKGNSVIYHDSQRLFLSLHQILDVQFLNLYLDTGDYQIIARLPIADRDTTNNQKEDYFECAREMPAIRDIVMKEIISPRGEYLEGTLLRPSVVIENKGNFIETFTTYFLIPPYYTKAMTVFGLLPNEERQINFLSLLLPAGDYEAQSFISSPFSQDPKNDSLTGSFVVKLPAPVPDYPWVLFPALPYRLDKPTMVRAGGALTAVKNFIFALKGGNTVEFYRYDIHSGKWEKKKPIPIEGGKGVKEGGGLTSDGQNTIYGIKGNNTVEFFGYEITTDTWFRLRDAPMGEKGKKIKGGAAITFVRKGESSFVFLTKGGGSTEFFVYWIEGDTWLKRKDIPLGKSNKGLKNGSALMNFANEYLFLLKGGTNEFYAYSIKDDSWLVKKPIPLYAFGSSKKTRVKKGAALTSDNEYRIYAFKGNSNEFYLYFPATDSWVEKETLPRPPSGKKVKDGGALTFVEGKVYALKGNRTLEFWCYTPDESRLFFNALDHIPSSELTIPSVYLTCSPNPTRDKLFIRCRSGSGLGIPKGRGVIYNSSGEKLSSFLFREDNISLSLRWLKPGVYFIHLRGENFSERFKVLKE